MTGVRPLPSSSGVSARMQRQLRRDTAPELAVRRALHAEGFRFRLGWRVPGISRRTIDIAFPGRKLAVFVDGCFWHSCPQHRTSPRANSTWWARKLEKNVERDRETDEALRAGGWTVVRVWEHDPPEVAVALVREAIRPGNAARG